MNLLCWNCWGLGNPRTVHELTKLVRRYNPFVLFLSETKRKSVEMERLCVIWGYDNCMMVDSIGKGRGLALLWMNEVCLEVLSFSNHHIDSKLGDPACEETWRFTGFYGYPVAGDRWKSWNILRRLFENNSLLWLCAGDFNEILYDNEKMGGSMRPPKQMEDFRNVTHECNLQEVSFYGPKFTWSRGKSSNMILERLDRGLASEDWLLRF